MLYKMSVKLAKKLVEHSEDKKEDIYIYGLELIISTIIGLSSILLISYMLSQLKSGLIFILKGDKTPTSIGGELQQFSLGGSPISFQDKASGGSQAWSAEECFAFDHAAARTPEAFLK